MSKPRFNWSLASIRRDNARFERSLAKESDPFADVPTVCKHGTFVRCSKCRDEAGPDREPTTDGWF